MVMPAIFLVLATSVGASSLPAAFAYLTIGTAFSALTLASVSVNHLDVAPKYAGFIFGAGNTLATLAGLISVPVSGIILDRTGSFSQVISPGCRWWCAPSSDSP
jgi:MFS transporter, ACS family, solute carrier family 17 (sodium-dependent inorganic phosphate cotransporter), other